MRKFLSMLLVLTLMFALAVPAFAAADYPGNVTFASDAATNAWANSNAQDIDVHAKLTKGEASWGTAKYKVKIDWEVTDISGSYNNAYQWNVDNATYELQHKSALTVVSAGELKVTITNSSNSKVQCALSSKSINNDGATPTAAALATVTVPTAITVEAADAGIAKTDDGTNKTGVKKTGTLTATFALTEAGLNYIAKNNKAGECVTVGTFTVTVTPAS